MEDVTKTPDQEDEEIQELIDTEEDVEESSAEELKAKLAKSKELLKEAIKTKKNWRSKAEELQSKLPKTDSLPTTTPTEKPADEVVVRLSKLELEAEKRQFGYAHGLSPEETDKAFAFAKGSDMKPDEVLKDEFFKKGLDALRAQNGQAGNTPHTSRRLPKVEGKTFNEMSDAERRKNWAKV